MKYKGFEASIRINENNMFCWEGKAERIIDNKIYTLYFAGKTLLEAYKDFKEGIYEHYSYLKEVE